MQQHSRQQWPLLVRCFVQHALHMHTHKFAIPETRAFAAIPETSVGSAEQAIEGAAQPRGDGHDTHGRHRWFPGAVLKRFGRDLTDQARRGLLDPVIGRDTIIQRALQVLLRRAKNNPCLIGDAGVGKTAIVEGIAQLMVSQQVPPGLAGKHLIALDVTGLVAGSAYRGEFESRLKGLLKDVADARNVILFIDEMHMLMGAGASEGGLDASNILKPALARGGLLQCIGATTVEEWRQHIEPDAAFTRRWQPIMVQEPSLDAALACLQGLRPRYEAHHGVVITDGALKAAVRCAKRYITDRHLPDSAIDIMDESAARCLLKSSMETIQASKACEANAAATAAAAAEASAINSSPQAHQLTPLSPSLSPQSASSPQPHTSLDARIRAESKEGRPPHTAQHQGSPSQKGACCSGSTTSSSTSTSSSSPITSASSSSSSGANNRGSAPSEGADPGARRSRPVTDWQSWVARHGWQGHTEHERQRLLEWFGATPENPEPGSEGHRQTTAKRSLYRLVLEGAAPAHSAQARVHVGGRQAVAGGGGEASSVSAFGSSVPVGVRRLEVMPHTFNKSKACPQCGFLCDVKQSKLSEDGLRLRCPSCKTSFLNIPPEKLLMGTSTFQAESPFNQASTTSSNTLQQDQQGASHHASHSTLGAAHSDTSHAAVTHSSDHGPWREDMDNAHGPQLGPWLTQTAQQQQQQQQQSQPPGATPAAHIQVAPMTPDLQRLQAARLRQQAMAEAFARPFPIHCVVDEQDVLETVTESTGVPVTAMDSQAAHHLMDLEKALSKVVLGQSAAVHAVASAVRLWRMGLLQADSRPAASFVFRGPPGVGKSLMCKELARHVMGDEQALLRFQMSEYTDRASLARLIGAPPGYVGYGRSTGTLVDAVRRRPHCVLVLEDVDKAHPEVLEVLLRIVDEGTLSDSQGRRASFESAFVVFTLSDRSAYKATHPTQPSSSQPQHKQQQQQQQQQHELEPAAQPGAHRGSVADEQGVADSSGGSDTGESADSGDVSDHGGVRGSSGAGASSLVGAMSSSSSSSSSSSGSSRGSSGGGGGGGVRTQPASPTVQQLLSLVDATVGFAPLGCEQLARIVEAQLAEVAAQFSHADVALGSGAAGVSLEVDDAARAFLVDQVEVGRAGLPGAQHVRSLIRTHVMGPVAELLLLHSQQQQQQQQESKSSGSMPVIKVSYKRQEPRSTGEGAAEGSTGRLVFNLAE